ncbi:MAG: type II toxin-antitoxin system VapC family toxin [Cyanobacteriota bacterium]|nr:type II toxin-antitoxin system VapC family toxin [Cyanobacteriota bacterium]
MRVLLDTHVFIWIDDSPEKVSRHVMSLLLNTDNILMLSMASLWEMQIEIQLGKLQLNAPLPEVVATQQQINALQILPIELTHIFALDGLPKHHRDPFDRLLIAQAIVTQIPILS